MVTPYGCAIAWAAAEGLPDANYDRRRCAAPPTGGCARNGLTGRRAMPRRRFGLPQKAPATRAPAPNQAMEPQAQLRDLVRAEQVRLLFADGGVSVMTTLVISAALAGLLLWQKAMAPLPAAIWIGLLAAQTLFRLGIRDAYLKALPGVGDWRRWARLFVAGTAAGGVVWGLGLPWLFAPGRFDLQALVLAMLISGTYGIIGSAGAYLPAFWTFILPIVPAVAWLAVQGDPLHVVCAVVIVLWTPSVAVLGLRYNASLVEALELRFENAALADDLRAQKQVSDQNSQAKSRFLASASHDLRQPVHALGMFVGALRSHKLPARSVALIDHIDGSIRALDSLFTSLLDISKLDAGVVEHQVAAVAVQPLLARICRDLDGEASAKGVALRLARTRLAVRSDAILLERVMRNLIGNAVRYTETGAVLVGARRRGGPHGGERVSLEVLDTGPGIAADQHEAIFEEFYQLANPDRDRSKGLGLGLPIVRRLTAILNHPLELESQPGRGSAFRVYAPRTVPPRLMEPDFPTGLGDSRSALILAIDDEQAIRVAMTELLRSWGHRVIAVGGGDEAIAALAHTATPDLIICDYRLRGRENGLEVIRRMRAAMGSMVPAILVTGDTAPENIRQALAGGHPLLHKPLSHARLRAAVSSLIRRPAEPQPAAE
jgi:signal transduction histidine kinase/CheY-like chemotaxis protein